MTKEYEAIFVHSKTKLKFKLLAVKTGQTFDQLLKSLMAKK